MVNINLIADRLALQRNTERMIKTAAFTSLGLLAVALLYGTAKLTTLRALQDGTRSEQGNIRTFEQQKVEMDNLRQQVDEKEPVVALLTGARDSTRKWCLALRDLTVPLTPTIILTDVHSSNNMRPPMTMVQPVKKDDTDSKQTKTKPDVYEGLIVQGYAASHAEATSYARQVEDQPTFSDVYVIYTRMTKRGDLDVCQFELHCFIRKVPQKQETKGQKKAA